MTYLSKASSLLQQHIVDAPFKWPARIAAFPSLALGTASSYATVAKADPLLAIALGVTTVGTGLTLFSQAQLERKRPTLDRTTENSTDAVIWGLHMFLAMSHMVNYARL